MAFVATQERWKLVAGALACVVVFLIVGGMTRGAATESEYSSLDLDKCVQLSVEEGPALLKCKGLSGLPVFVSESDMRFVVAFGEKPESQCFSRWSFYDFNAPGDAVEWRRENEAVFAAILRWHLHQGDGQIRKSWLVVTRLGSSRATCPVAYVEGSADGANDTAREISDQLARKFNCTRDTPQIIGSTDIALSSLIMRDVCR